MAKALPLLQPYAAYTLIDADATRDPYFTLRLISSKSSCHGIVRRLIYDLGFQRHETQGYSICIRHGVGDFIFYGSNPSSVLDRLPEIAELTVFDPACHQPADRRAPIFTRMEVKRYLERYPRLQQWLQQSSKRG